MLWTHSTGWKKKEEEKPCWLRDKSYFLSASCLMRRCCPAICPDSAGTERRCDRCTKESSVLPASLPAISPFLTSLMLDVVPFDAPVPAQGAGTASLLLSLSEILCPILCCKQAGFYAGIVQTVMLESKASQGVWGLLFSMLA